VTAPALAHVLAHARDALATDARVGELGLEVESVDGALVVVRGTISTPSRQLEVVPVVVEVLAAHGYSLPVRDDTSVPPAGGPVDLPERL
jgi:hypothetical protein